ncbi:hypothetical protein BDV27DRAFT_120779 [Aspergillus caelatus]|uniref:AA1-like domain-containing protein n=1 Tax=Aspergillus caelatus TaxID=61420 RepID=A0A5N7ALE2_9EURO|nr:uncharacterized protein BDV27DRAFT_120779 [Aspergillus caelatus]KAE8369530.1 hypothetical protein BDV27DRAFT_120779 [Aspergillus caelatus]
MRLFSLLAAATTALFASPSFAGSPIAGVEIDTIRPDRYLAKSHECVTVDPTVRFQPVRHIGIRPISSGIGVECTFYRDPHCHSDNDPDHPDSYTLHEGSYSFKRRFLVGGFKCVEPDSGHEFL